MDDYTISWTAPEYEYREHSADWYWAVGIVSISLAVAFIIANNTLLSIIILLGMGTLLAHARHRPNTLEYKLSKNGVRAGETLYPWETLESFWVLKEKEGMKYPYSPKILFTSKKRLLPQVVVPLNETVIDEVHEVLAHILPEEPQAEPLPNRLMRIIGF